MHGLDQSISRVTSVRLVYRHSLSYASTQWHPLAAESLVRVLHVDSIRPCQSAFSPDVRTAADAPAACENSSVKICCSNMQRTYRSLVEHFPRTQLTSRYKAMTDSHSPSNRLVSSNWRLLQRKALATTQLNAASKLSNQAEMWIIAQCRDVHRVRGASDCVATRAVYRMPGKSAATDMT
jgi:hypothetical protein